MSRRRGQRPDHPVGPIAEEPRSIASSDESAGAAAVKDPGPDVPDSLEANAMARIRAMLTDDELRLEALRLIREALEALDAGGTGRRGGRRPANPPRCSLDRNGV